MRESSPERSAHDILAAEAFAVPAPDPTLRHDLAVPADPAGIPEPHDILAAEEFAMPAPGPGSGAQRVPAAASPRRAGWAGAAGVGLLAWWLRRR